MSKKRKCYKNGQKSRGKGFPFLLLLYWLKEDRAQKQTCACGSQAVYAWESYIDHEYVHAAVKKGKTVEEIEEELWPEMVKKQKQGIYTRRVTSYYCHLCALLAVQAIVDTKPAIITMTAPTQPGIPRSVVIVARMEYLADKGLVGAGFTSIQTLEDLKEVLHHPEKASFFSCIKN